MSGSRRSLSRCAGAVEWLNPLGLQVPASREWNWFTNSQPHSKNLLPDKLTTPSGQESAICLRKSATVAMDQVSALTAKALATLSDQDRPVLLPPSIEFVARHASARECVLRVSPWARRPSFPPESAAVRRPSCRTLCGKIGGGGKHSSEYTLSIPLA